MPGSGPGEERPGQRERGGDQVLVAEDVRIAFGIMQVLKVEQAAVAFDFHEAGPESRLAWMVVGNPKNLEIADAAVLDLEAQGLAMKLEPSSETFRGLSHREWGDATKARSFLFETPSPSMVEAARTVDPVNDPKLQAELAAATKDAARATGPA